MGSPGFCLVTPASRGLGFAFARHLLAHSGLPVVATARRDCDEVRDQLLDNLNGHRTRKGVDGRLSVYPVDVTDESTIASLATHIKANHPNTPLRLALTIPGALHVEKSPAQIDATNALHSFQVNALGPLLLAKHLTPFLPTRSSPPFTTTNTTTTTDADADSDSDSDGKPGSKLKLPPHAIYALMAARVGSISDNTSGGWYSYRASKASVFQVAKTLDLFLRSRSRERSVAVALHPGTVRTDFTKDYWGGRDGWMLEPADAAERLLGVLSERSLEGRGRCWDWKGEEVKP